MDATTQNASSTADREIVIERIFDAPRELVWEAWTNPEHVAQWWGPDGFTTTIEKMDFRVGGAWKHVMHGPDGKNYPNSSVFREIVKPERIVFAHGGRREGGPGAHFLSTWTFEALGKRTKVTMRLLFDTPADRDLVVREFGAIEGGKQTFARLAGYLPQMAAFIITRTFDAPRELVWKAWTEKAHLQKWFGPKRCTITVAQMDFRPGGIFHYCMTTPDNKEMWGKWTFREIVEPQRIVLVNSFSDANGGITRHPMSAGWPLEMLTRTTFTEQGGKTLLTLEWSPYNATAEECATFNAAHPGMTQGWTGTFEQLENYLAGLAKH